MENAALVLPAEFESNTETERFYSEDKEKSANRHRYRVFSAQTVDVTTELAKLFNPNERAWKSIKSLEKWKPYTQEQIRKMEKEHPGF